MVVVTRDGGDADFTSIRLAGLIAERDYLVHFQDDPRQLTMTGRQLMLDGVDVNLPATQCAEIVYVEPLNP